MQIGRPRAMPDEVLERIRRERSEGKTLAAIAEGLNEDRVATAQGGRHWYPATVRAVLGRVDRTPLR